MVLPHRRPRQVAGKQPGRLPRAPGWARGKGAERTVSASPTAWFLPGRTRTACKLSTNTQRSHATASNQYALESPKVAPVCAGWLTTRSSLLAGWRQGCPCDPCRRPEEDLLECRSAGGDGLLAGTWCWSGLRNAGCSSSESLRDQLAAVNDGDVLLRARRSPARATSGKWLRRARSSPAASTSGYRQRPHRTLQTARREQNPTRIKPRRARAFCMPWEKSVISFFAHRRPTSEPTLRALQQLPAFHSDRRRSTNKAQATLVAVRRPNRAMLLKFNADLLNLG